VASAIAPRSADGDRWGEPVVAAGAIVIAVMVSTSPEDSGPVMTAASFLATTADSSRVVDSGVVDLAISPDGTTLVYSAGGPYGRHDVQLVRRSVDNLHAMPIEGAAKGFNRSSRLTASGLATRPIRNMR